MWMETKAQSISKPIVTLELLLIKKGKIRRAFRKEQPLETKYQLSWSKFSLLEFQGPYK
jgi:hypothetical protein